MVLGGTSPPPNGLASQKDESMLIIILNCQICASYLQFSTNNVGTRMLSQADHDPVPRILDTRQKSNIFISVSMSISMHMHRPYMQTPIFVASVLPPDSDYSVILAATRI